MDWFNKYFRKKQCSDRPFRRIYKGDVPFLRDSEHDLQRSLFQQSGRTRRKSVHSQVSGGLAAARGRKSKESEDSQQQDEPVPRPVRRQSIARDAPESTLRKPDAVPEKFPDNFIVTARYTIWNFIPKNLFEQFRRIVNFYFLIIALVQSIIDSPVHPVTAVSPLAFVIFVTAIKQGYEDWLRHKNDDQVNFRVVRVIRDDELVEIKSKDIQVGDIIKLEADDQVPTDILVLGSSDEFLRCQINTANLDGETNLKLRYCPSGLPHFRSVEDFENLHVIVECEHPNEDLYEFNGSLLIPADKLAKMHWAPSESTTNIMPQAQSQAQESTSAAQSYSTSTEPTNPADGQSYAPDFSSGLIRQGMTDFLSIPLSMENMALRGTRLKNTDFVFGIVVYTGRDTRLARNSEKSEAKFSTVESAVNYYLMFFITVLLFIVVFCTLMHFFVNWFPETTDSVGAWYINDRDNKASGENVTAVLNTIASFIVLFNYIIPISLYVTVELQKFLGSKFFVWDLDMMDEEGREPLCNTSDLNEELGQIEYLFSDKTGTLTQNVMQFRHCSIEATRYEYKPDNKLYPFSSMHSTSRTQMTDNGGSIDIMQHSDTLNFFKTLALCHSVQVVPKRRPSFDVHTTSPGLTFPDLKLIKKGKKSDVIDRRASLVTPEPPQNDVQVHGSWEFQASSPDEKALLEACQQLGIHYRGEKEDMMTLDVFGEIVRYKRLMQLEFDADRKCMSVIVENSKGEVWLLTKGAESSIIPKCDQGPTQETLKHVMDYALMGLRTLAVSVRKLTAKEFEEFSANLRAARRQIKNRQEKVREVYSQIESHMTLIGATGVEDQLQENVPETLQAFAAAGIRVWMITGDKLETGVNVAISCGLITASTKQYIVNKISNIEEMKARLMEISKEIDESDNTCFVIDGDSLNMAFKGCPDLLRQVSMAAFRVVCCRMTPLQKAQVVQMVKDSPGKPTCCAVGDGANDCAMILAAHIGIGILGKEGRQAARCADFALAKFGFLKKAILVHGHWYYVRLANLANYFFYKNVVFVMPQFFFSFNSNFSTQAIFNGLFLMNFNIFFASCPIFFYGLTEQPYPADTLLTQPHLYKKNRKNSLMTVQKFIPWLISALWHSAVCYYLPYFAWDNFDNMNDFMTFGTVVFTAIVIAANCKMAVETKFVSWWYVGSQIFSYASYFILTSLYAEVDFRAIRLDSGDFRHVYFTMLSSACFWLLMLLVAVAAITPDISFAALRHSWKHIVRHFQGFGKGRKWLKFQRKSLPFPKATLLFTKRSGTLTISNSTLSSYATNT